MKTIMIDCAANSLTQTGGELELYDTITLVLSNVPERLSITDFQIRLYSGGTRLFEQKGFATDGSIEFALNSIMLERAFYHTPVDGRRVLDLQISDTLNVERVVRCSIRIKNKDKNGAGSSVTKWQTGD